MRGLTVVIGLILIYLGAGLTLIAALGLARLKDAYSRFHVATKALTAGVLFLGAGSALYAGEVMYLPKLGLIILLFLISNPIGTHAIARAVHRLGVEPESGQGGMSQHD